LQIDFRRSLPPLLPSLHSHMVAAMAVLTYGNDLGMLNHESIPGGAEADREAGARFLAPRLGQGIPATRLIITNGTQSAILLLLRGLVRRGGLLVAERLSYGPLPLLAQLAGVRLQGLDIDADGIIPESFEAVCRSAKPEALYCNPTVQNPTTALMPERRRIALAAIARQYGVAIIEDDALGRLHPQAPKPIASWAPDITWYVMGTTKCLTHGLRLAYLVVPSASDAERVIGPVQHLSYWHPAPLLSALATRLIDSGAADSVCRELMKECFAREAAAREVLSDFGLHSKPGSMHVWLDLPQEWTGNAFVQSAQAQGVLLRPAGKFAVDDQPTPNSVRLSLSTPAAVSDVRRGLEIVGAMLAKCYVAQEGLSMKEL
jgi:DNA-binding transcriptional MocR family regulator